MTSTPKHYHGKTNQRNPTSNAQDHLIRHLISRWNLRQHPQVAACFRAVLAVMIFETLYALLDSRLQVAVVPESTHGVWAYFPVSYRREIVRRHGITLTPSGRVLLLVSEEHVLSRPPETTLNELAHQIGHIFAYLRNPGHVHDCEEASAVCLEIGFGKLLHRRTDGKE